MQQRGQGRSAGLLHGRAHGGFDRLPIRAAVFMALSKDTAEELVYSSPHLLMESSRRFFPPLSPAAPLSFHVATRTDALTEGHQFRTEFLEATKLGDLLLRFAESGGVGETLRDGFACDAAGQAELGIVAGVIRLRAMAGGLATAAGPMGLRVFGEAQETWSSCCETPVGPFPRRKFLALRSQRDRRVGPGFARASAATLLLPPDLEGRRQPIITTSLLVFLLGKRRVSRAAVPLFSKDRNRCGDGVDTHRRAIVRGRTSSEIVGVGGRKRFYRRDRRVIDIDSVKRLHRTGHIRMGGPKATCPHRTIQIGNP